jgi:hypothetical protein
MRRLFYSRRSMAAAWELAAESSRRRSGGPAPLGTIQLERLLLVLQRGRRMSFSLRGPFAQASPTVSRIEAVSASAGDLPAHTTY